MKNFFSLAVLFLIFFSCNQEKYDLAIANVKLFDSKTTAVLDNKTVLIRADTIAAIIDGDKSFNATNTIEGKQRLLTSGFIDTHVHMVGNYGVDASTPEDYKEDDGLKMLRDLTAYHYLNHGVTTIIDMGQPETWMDVTLNWQKNPKPYYPNLFINGGSIVSDEDRRQPAHHIEVKNPEDGRQKVRDYAAKGVKFMKLYRKLRKPDYEAMADEAKKQGVIINSHVDNNVVTISEAIDYGVLNFEHFFTLTPSILDYDTHWPLMNKHYGIKMCPSIDEFAAQMVYFFGYIKKHPEFESKLDALFDKMAAQGATISTAFNVLASSASQSDFFTSFEYFPIRKTPMVSYSDEQQKQLDEAYKDMMYYAKRAHNKGVKLRIGTDCRFGGRALLSELIQFHKAGFTIAEILQIATLNGYKAMKLDDKRGSVSTGKMADLILFDKNPFDDAKHFLSKKTIIKDGQIFNSKKSISHELMQVLLNDGPEADMSWLENAKTDSNTYAQLKASELKNTVKELFGGSKINEAMRAYNIYKAEFPNTSYTMDATSITNIAYELIRKNKIEDLKAFYKFCSINFPDEKKFLGLSIYMAILEGDITAGKIQFRDNKENIKYVLDENELNGLGYLYLQSGKIKEAIAVFEMNTTAFPKSWNVYDSLGEAYLKHGNTVKAKLNYKKSIILNPDNTAGKAVLKRL